MIIAGIMMSPFASLAAPSGIAERASKGISEEAKKIVWPIAIIVLIGLGLMIAFGGERLKENAKSHGGRLVLGILIVVFAISLVMWFKGII